MIKIISNYDRICKFSYHSNIYIYRKISKELYREYNIKRYQTVKIHIIEGIEKDYVLENLYKYLREEKLKRIINKK